MSRISHLFYQEIVEPIDPTYSVETVTTDKWFVRHENPVLRKVALSTAILAGSFFFQQEIVAQEEVTVDKWFQPISQPYFSKIRQLIPTGESRFELPREIFIDDWQQQQSLPVKTKTRLNLGGETRTEVVVSAEELTVDKWFRPLSEPNFSKKRFYHTGESKFETPRDILVTDWFTEIRQPYFSKERFIPSGELKFELPRTILVSDWYQPVSQPRIVRFRNSMFGETRTELEISEVVTIDKWYQPITQPVIRKETRQTGGESRFELPRLILVSDWYQPLSQPYINVQRSTGAINNLENVVVPINWLMEIVQQINKRKSFITGENKFELPVVPFDWYQSQPEQVRKFVDRIFAGEVRIDVEQEVVTMDKWFIRSPDPYFSRRRFYFTGSIFVQLQEQPVTPYYPFECPTDSVIFVKGEQPTVIIELDNNCNKTIYE